MVKHGLSPAAAAARFYILDHKGLITERVGAGALFAGAQV